MSEFVPLKHSIATQLLRVIFGFYLIATILVTTIQIVFEYRHVRQQVIQEIEKLPQSYGLSIASALWAFNTNQLQSVLIGMRNIPSVVGVKIEDGTNMLAIGLVDLGEDSYAEYDKENTKIADREISVFSKLVSHNFPITHADAKGRVRQLGHGTIYSSSEIIIDRVKYGFLLILFNSIVKTLALWFIFLYFVRRLLGQPLAEFADKTHATAWDSLREIHIVPARRHPNELNVIERAFNRMIQKLTHTKFQIQVQRDLLETRVAQRTEELAKVNKELEEFNYVASHDLQEPLRTITSYGQLLREDLGDDLPTDAQQDLRYMTQAAQRMSGLITDLLDLSHAQRTHLQISEFDLERLLQTIKDDLRVKIAEEKAEVIWESLLPSIVADKFQISLVLQNLIQNALKYRHPERAPKIHISAELENELQLISVRDNGLGIAPEHHDKIFKPFKRLHGVGEYSGSGIGLAIVSKIISRHHGEVSLSSELGKGSVFTIRLPIPVVDIEANSASSDANSLAVL